MLKLACCLSNKIIANVSGSASRATEGLALDYIASLSMQGRAWRTQKLNLPSIGGRSLAAAECPAL